MELGQKVFPLASVASCKFSKQSRKTKRYTFAAVNGTARRISYVTESVRYETCINIGHNLLHTNRLEGTLKQRRRRAGWLSGDALESNSGNISSNLGRTTA
jgi:hypothetical protein